MSKTLLNKNNSTDYLLMFPHFHFIHCRLHQPSLSIVAKVSLVLMLFFSALQSPSHAQQPSFKCTRLTTEDGLSDNMVFCALQDRYGFMWFGTRDGLNRYDGHKFTVYRHNPKDANSLSDDAISCVYEDSMGNLWVGTQQGGLNRFNRIQGTFTHFIHDPSDPQTINQGQIATICEDTTGNLWISTAYPDPSLQKFNPLTGSFCRYFHDSLNPSSISSNLISGICRDSNGTIWIGTFNKGINRYDPSRDVFINRSTCRGYDSQCTGNIISIQTTAPGTFWVCDTTHSIHRLHFANETFHVTSFRPREFSAQEVGSVRAFLQDQYGYLWIGIEEAGLYVINPNLKDYYYYRSNAVSPYGLSSNNRIRSLVADRDNNIWIGTDRGINFFHRQTRFFMHSFDQYPNAVHSVPSQIRSLWKNHQQLWVGTYGQGLYRLEARTYQHYVLSHANSHYFNANTVNVIYPTNQGNLLIGTNDGIYKQSISGDFRYLPLKIEGWRIWSILEDAKKNLWIGSLHEGLSQVDQATSTSKKYFHNYSMPDMLWGNSHVFALEEDKRKHLLWIGSNQGLYCYNQQSGALNHYTHRDNDSTSLSHNHVWYIHQAVSGLLWIGTSGGGLNVLDPKTGKFKHYTEEDGLPSNIICGILEDSHGNLWISTNRGLSKFTPSTGVFRNFGIGDGLYISEFHFKTCFKDENGGMYFGGMGGYVEFHPDSITINTNPPLLALTSFKVFDKDLQLDTSITYKEQVLLKHSDNYFSIEFTALDFTNPVKNKYRYKLIGYDEQWRETDGSRPYASYTTVPPGTYTFHLQASNSDGIWNTKGTKILIVVLPAWWQTLWFRSAIAVALLLVLAGSGYWRYRHMKHRSLMEKKLVESQLQALRSQMNPHFIFNSLNSILHFITSNDADTAHIFLSKFSKLIRATLEHSRSEFILLSEELRLLSIYLELEALRFDNHFAYEIIVDPSIDIYAQQIPPLLIQPYVENAIKHGLIHTMEDGKISVLMKREGHQIVCSVIDNGIGRQRAQELKQQSLHRYISRGISLTKDRLDILNSIHSERYGVEINDLTDHSGYSCGTRVDIRISYTKGNDTKGNESVA